METDVHPKYVVQEGDYLHKIAEEHEVTVMDLIEWNVAAFPSLAVNRDLIYPGWLLHVRRP
jgi:LysM repeat protein